MSEYVCPKCYKQLILMKNLQSIVYKKVYRCSDECCENHWKVLYKKDLLKKEEIEHD